MAGAIRGRLNPAGGGATADAPSGENSQWLPVYDHAIRSTSESDAAPLSFAIFLSIAGPTATRTFTTAPSVSSRKNEIVFASRFAAGTSAICAGTGFAESQDCSFASSAGRTNRSIPA